MDPEIEFLVNIKTADNETIDISNYLITKAFIKLNHSTNDVLDILLPQ